MMAWLTGRILVLILVALVVVALLPVAVYYWAKRRFLKPVNVRCPKCGFRHRWFQ